MKHKRKAAQSVRMKDVTRGEVEVVFATLDVVDHDGDVLRKSSFEDGAPVVISAYGHGSHRGQLPLGRGRIDMSEDGVAKMVGRFFMDTSHGRDAFLTVKALSDDEDGAGGLQEWSFSLDNVKAHTETIDGQSVNVIDSVYVKEVSPVLQGAGIDTRTLVAKSALKQSAEQTVRALRSAGQERWGSDDTYVYVEDWDPDEATAVFNVWNSDGEKLIQVSFERDGAAVALGDDETEVARVTEYVPKQLSVPNFAEMVKAIAGDVASLRRRAEEVLTSRAARGKSGLSRESAVLIADLESELGELTKLAGTADETTEPPAHADEPGLSPMAAAIEIATLEVS